MMKDGHQPKGSFREQYEAGRTAVRGAVGGLLRGSLIFWVAVTVWALLLWGMEALAGEEVSVRWLPLFTLPALWLILPALWLILAVLLLALAPIHTRDKHTYLLAVREQESWHAKETVRRLLVTPSLYWETGAFAAWTWLFPLFSTHIVQAVLSGAQPGEKRFLLIQLLLMILPFWLLNTAAGVLARRRWFRTREQYDLDQPLRTIPIGYVVRETLLWILNAFLFCYLLGVLIMIAPYITVIAGAFGWGNAFFVLVLVIGIPAVVRWTRTLFARARLLKRLRTICRNKKYTLSQLHNPYLRAVFPCRGAELAVDTGDARYVCKLIACHHRRVRLLFQPGRYVFYHRLGLVAA